VLQLQGWVQQQQAAAEQQRAAAEQQRAAVVATTTHPPSVVFHVFFRNPLWLRAAEKFKPLFGSKTIH